MGIPYYVLINPEGKIEQRIIGYEENMFTEFLQNCWENKGKAGIMNQK